ncbi:hypothetical protein C8Q79DRAFT_83345 [Trametes meyenii]|nr:hypothetical protein C8Q79DRAFT_83345 [Trametes meyenii]
MRPRSPTRAPAPSSPEQADFYQSLSRYTRLLRCAKPQRHIGTHWYVVSAAPEPRFPVCSGPPRSPFGMPTGTLTPILSSPGPCYSPRCLPGCALVDLLQPDAILARRYERPMSGCALVLLRRRVHGGASDVWHAPDGLLGRVAAKKTIRSPTAFYLTEVPSRTSLLRAREYTQLLTSCPCHTTPAVPPVRVRRRATQATICGGAPSKPLNIRFPCTTQGRCMRAASQVRHTLSCGRRHPLPGLNYPPPCAHYLDSLTLSGSANGNPCGAPSVSTDIVAPHIGPLPAARPLLRAAATAALRFCSSQLYSVPPKQAARITRLFGDAPHIGSCLGPKQTFTSESLLCPVRVGFGVLISRVCS